MFIPESYITEVGYEQGRDLVVYDTGESYRGFYHKDKNNRYWSGEKHTESSFLLKKISGGTLTLKDFVKYNHYNAGFTSKYRANLIVDVPFIKGSYNPPKEEDYDIGYYNRYIIQINASKHPYIVETNKENFILVSSRFKNYYSSVSLIWKLKGPLEDVYKDNIRMISGIKNTNLRSIQQAKKTIKDIELLLNNPLQFTHSHNLST